MQGELTDLAPEIYRQRLIIEGKYEIDVDEEVVGNYLRDLTDFLKMKPMTEPFVFSPDKFGNPIHKGLNGFIGWVESGGHIYTWREPKFFTVDIYACKKFNPKKVADFTGEFFESDKMQFREV